MVRYLRNAIAHFKSVHGDGTNQIGILKVWNFQNGREDGERTDLSDLRWHRRALQPLTIGEAFSDQAWEQNGKVRAAVF